MAGQGKNEGRPRSIDDVLRVAEDDAYVRVATARVYAVPQALRDEHAHLTALLPTLVSDDIDDHPERLPTAERIVEIEEAMEASVIEFRFRSIGHRAWSDLLKEHAPSPAQRRENRDLDYNPDTFPFQAMAASCDEPVMTVEQVRRFEASPLCDVSAWSDMWNACLRANVVDKVPKSPAAAGVIRRMSGASGQRPSTIESLEASFSAE